MGKERMGEGERGACLLDWLFDVQKSSFKNGGESPLVLNSLTSCSPEKNFISIGTKVQWDG